MQEKMNTRPDLAKKEDPNYSVMLGVMDAISSILAVRFFLFVAVCGALGLAYVGMADQTSHSLWMVAIYCLLTIIPLVVLDIKTREK